VADSENKFPAAITPPDIKASARTPFRTSGHNTQNTISNNVLIKYANGLTKRTNFLSTNKGSSLPHVNSQKRISEHAASHHKLPNKPRTGYFFLKSVLRQFQVSMQ